MTNVTKNYKGILAKMPKSQRVTAVYYNNGEGRFQLTYRGKFLGWAGPVEMKALKGRVNVKGQI